MKLQAWRPEFLLKKKHQHMYFSVNIAKLLRTVFFIEHLLLIILFRNFYVMIEFLGRLWVQNWYFSYFLCRFFLLFITLVLESGVHGYFVLVFILRFFVSITFARITTPESETTSSITATSPSNILWRMSIWTFWILCFAIIFL